MSHATSIGCPVPDATRQSRVILTVNGGSSSLKVAAFSTWPTLTKQFIGQIDRIGTTDAKWTHRNDTSMPSESGPFEGSTFEAAVHFVSEILHRWIGTQKVCGIGHRIVQGGVHLLDHQRITPDLIAELGRTQPFDLAHLPREIALIRAFQESFPETPQVACFDTVFHRDLPHVAQLLPIPRRYISAGVRKFGFHGLSYTSLMEQLAIVAGQSAANRRVIFAHLGSGASMVAVRDGKPIDTTMAFTPASGLVMGTRTGDIDPGLLLYLMKDQALSADAMDTFISEQCGLLAVSGTSPDMRELLGRRANDPRAADAVNLFCYQAKKHLCALVGVLGGVDTIVFAGGIGEHAPEIREQICSHLDFLTLKLDPKKNARADDVISSIDSRVTVRIIATDEETVIAKTVCALVTPANNSHSAPNTPNACLC